MRRQKLVEEVRKSVDRLGLRYGVRKREVRRESKRELTKIVARTDNPVNNGKVSFSIFRI